MVSDCKTLNSEVICYQFTVLRNLKQCSGSVRIFNWWVRDAKSDHQLHNKILSSKFLCAVFSSPAVQKIDGFDKCILKNDRFGQTHWKYANANTTINFSIDFLRTLLI